MPPSPPRSPRDCVRRTSSPRALRLSARPKWAPRSSARWRSYRLRPIADPMSQLILSAHSGSHDAVAAIFKDYDLIAAVQLERLTRHKGDGREHPDKAIDEVLSIAGATRADVDIVCFSRSEFPTIFYRNIRGVRWIREKYRKHVEGNTRRYMPPELLRYHTTNINDIFKVRKFMEAGGFR